MNNTISPKTLDQVVQPLVDFLNHNHRSPMDDYYINKFGQFGQLEEPANEVSIDLNIMPETPELTKRAFVTLLRKSGSNAMWCHVPFHGAPEEEDLYKTPLRFAVVKRTFDMECHLHTLTYMVIDHIGDDFDAEAAERQIALLVGYLEDPQNLDDLGPEELAIF